MQNLRFSVSDYLFPYSVAVGNIVRVEDGSHGDHCERSLVECCAGENCSTSKRHSPYSNARRVDNGQSHQIRVCIRVVFDLSCRIDIISGKSRASPSVSRIVEKHSNTSFLKLLWKSWVKIFLDTIELRA